MLHYRTQYVRSVCQKRAALVPRGRVLQLEHHRLILMFSQSSAFHTPDNANDRTRSPLTHSASQSSLHASFSVGGITSTAGAHHPHGTSSWASNSQSGTLSNSLNDPFLQSRSSYQSGYLMVRPFLVVARSNLFTFVYLQSTSQNNVRRVFPFSTPAETKGPYPRRFHPPPTNDLTTCLLCRPRPS